LNLTLGLGLSFVTLVIFSAIANSLLARDALPQFDLQLAAALRETATPSRVAFWNSVSHFGRLPAFAIPGVLLALLLARRERSWLPLVGFVASIGGSAILDVAVTYLFEHKHTPVRAELTIEMGTPSGQALGSLVGYGMIAYFLILLVRGHRTHVLIALSALALILAICFGRLYLGDRYFSDVMSGLAAGAVWLSACLTGLEVARRKGDASAIRATT
jgi:undecaprenyl-diphosphatase